MARYIDGYVLPVPKNKIKTYKKMAAGMGNICKKYGALNYVECVADDLTPKHSTLKFAQMAKMKKGETVVFSFVIYKSRAHRDAVNAKVMKQMQKDYAKYKDMPMPFDMKRMAYAGFKALVDL